MPRPSRADAERRADLAACAKILREGSRSFHAASLLLPARVRAPATALYAFCRVADDAIDAGHDPKSLARITARLDGAYARRPDPNPVDRAFASVVAEKRIPRAIPDALLEGFEWDLSGKRYATLAELEAYAVRVAGTVGLMMALVMGVRNEAALARALDLGVAMQLTNIARDVGEDARAGRLYLPLDWLAEEGIDPDALLRSPRFSPALGRVTKRLLAAADALYRRSEYGIAALPADCRPAIAAAGKIYSAIGREIARRNHDSVSRRAVVAPSSKLWRLIAAMAAIAPGRVGPAAPPLEAGRALIAAVTGLGEMAENPRPRFGDRIGGVAEAFARLERLASPAKTG